MFTNIITVLAAFITSVIGALSYGGIVLLMAIESCNIPLPSELIMPFAGYLSYLGKLNFHLAAIAGAVGCVLGSLVSYYLGYYGGRPFLEKYGKYLLLTKHDIDKGDELFKKYGDLVALVSRVLPIIRTFISFPAGVARMNIKTFIAYTFLGSLIWSYILEYIGIKVGGNEKALSDIFHKFDLAIGIVLIAGITYFIYTHIKKFGSKS